MRALCLLCLLASPLPVLAQAESPFKPAPAPTELQHRLLLQQQGQQRPLMNLFRQFGPQLIEAAPSLFEKMSQQQRSATPNQTMQSPEITIPGQTPQSPEIMIPGQAPSVPFASPGKVIRSVQSALPPGRRGTYEVRGGRVYYYPER